MSLLDKTIFFTLALSLTTTLACKKKQTETAPTTTTTTAAPAEAADEVPREVTEMRANFERVFFDFDSSELTDTTKTLLDSNVALMQKKSDIKVECQGHADERGTTDYNLALGQRRAQSVYNYMTARGIAPSRIKVVSYGEERPLSRGGSETAWTKNRRAEFKITWGDDSSVSGTTD